MTAFADTSFLCALYVAQSDSSAAIAHSRTMTEAFRTSGLVLFEFRQSVRFQSWLYAQDRTKGYSRAVGEAALVTLQRNIDAGAIRVLAMPWSDVLSRGEELSSKHTASQGCRGFDVLHVASALCIAADEFLSFDANQRRLAAAEGLAVKP